MAARFRIIILDKPDPANPLLFRYLFWADVPVARQPFYAKPAGTVSAWKDALAGDNAQLVSGAVVEVVDTIQVPPGAVLADIEAFLQARWAAFQSQVTTVNQWSRYGTTWDGAAWVLTGVA